MKRIVLVVGCLAVAAGAGYAAYPEEYAETLTTAGAFGRWVWDGVRASPVPVALALGTFLLTVCYHKARGKSLRESVEVAATRVALVPVPAGAEAENPVVRRAKARATRTQLLADQIGLENRHRRLPEEIVKAEKESCYTQQAVADAQRKLADKRRAHEEASARLEALRGEKARADAELAAIEAELAKLADVA